MINRDDMLELTRRMTPARSCFDRIAGAYIDDMGEVDESFNIHFGKLTTSDKAKNLELAKNIPFSKTNVQLKESVPFLGQKSAILLPCRSKRNSLGFL